MKYKITERESFQVVGIKREISCVNGANLIEIPKMWADVHADGTNDMLFKLNNGRINGVLGVCVVKQDSQSELMDYWIATEYNGDTPEGLLNLEIPASKWGVFEVHGHMPDSIQNVWKQIYSEWFPSSNYEQTKGQEILWNENKDVTSRTFKSEIWIPILKKKEASNLY